MIKTAFADGLVTVTNVRTFANTMQQNEICKGMLSEIYFTFPRTSAQQRDSFHHCTEIKPTNEILWVIADLIIC